MSSALAMILAAAMAVPASEPVKVSGAIEERLDLRGEWKGTYWFRHEVGKANLMDGRLIFDTPQAILKYSFWAVDEGAGKLDLSLGSGIFCQQGDSVTICFLYHEEGRPVSFHAVGRQTLLILRRARPGK